MQDILERIGEQEGPLGLLLIALCSAIEYVFPPFPGDAVSLFAAFLVAARGWSMPLVLLAMTAGSLAGASVHWWLGTWLSGRAWQPKTARGHQILRGIRAVATGFARHGPAYLAVNRFVPAMRAFFFLTAGYIRMPFGRTLLWGGLSALLWNAGILALGWVAGRNRARLAEMVATYAKVAWAVLAAVALVLVVRWWRRRRRARLDTPHGGVPH